MMLDADPTTADPWSVVSWVIPAAAVSWIESGSLLDATLALAPTTGGCTLLADLVGCKIL